MNIRVRVSSDAMHAEKTLADGVGAARELFLRLEA
jgi:hypothetical protein